MIKQFLIFVCLLLLSVSFLSAQMLINGQTLFGNEWIDYNLTHYKMLISEDGMYRISKQDLDNAGIPTNSISGDQFKMFLLGQEIPIYVSAINGTMGNSDYIEFYARKNKGELDTLLYLNPQNEHPSLHYSMFTDTSSVFLTWDNNTTNKRYVNTSNNLSNPPVAESYYMHRESQEIVFKQSGGWASGVPYSQGGLYESSFKACEGYADKARSSRAINIPTSNIFNSGPDARVSLTYSSVEKDGSSQQFNIDVEGNLLITDVFNDYLVRNHTFNFSNAILDNSTTFNFTGLNTKLKVSAVYLDYPRSFNFNGEDNFSFKVAASSGKRFLNISNFNHGGSNPVLYDRTNNIRIEGAVVGGNVQIVLPPSAVERHLELISTAGGTPIAEIEERNFVDYTDPANQGDYIMISHKRFIGASPNYLEQYRAYRQTSGFNSIIVDVDELYDQFAYGIHRNPISIQNFTGYTLNNWVKPEYIFLVGKGRNYQSVRYNLGNQPLYIPTYGHPPSDNQLVATKFNNTPRIPLGRLPIKTNDELRIYLKKIKAYESNWSSLNQTIEEKGWMKHVLHLGGGDPTIQQSIQISLNRFKDIITQDQYGAQVISFFKTSTAPIQISQSDFLDSLINSGVSMITFYGHASTESFDFSLDSPENYQNFERYPIILSLGCFSGHIHASGRNIGEDFVLIEDQGAIAFIASVNLSSSTSLAVLGEEFYEALRTSEYNSGIGKIMQIAIANSSASPTLKQQMTIDGDPAIQVNPHPAPDYTVNVPTVTFEPAEMKVTEEAEISFDITNIGKSVSDSFMLRILRKLPNGAEIDVVNKLVPSPKYTQNYTFKIPPVENSVGVNTFTIVVDDSDLIVELPNPTAENNNTYSIDQFVFTDDIIPVRPYEFSIIGKANPTLKASISNPFSEEFTYYMEIDTTEDFNSPLKETKTERLAGGLMEWEPTIPYINNKVYYWRVSIDTTQAPNSAGWRTSSFIYIQNESPGWNQSHYHQWLKDRFVNIELPPNRSFEYIDDFKEIKVNVATSPSVLSYGNLNYVIGTNVIHSVGGCNAQVHANGINFVVLDPTTVEPWKNIGIPGSIYGEHNSINCKNSVSVFRYNTRDPDEREDAVNFLRDPSIIPAGHYVMAYSLYNYEPDEWASDVNVYGDDLFSAMADELGANMIQQTATQLLPYAGLFKVRDSSFSPIEILGDSTLAHLAHTFQIAGNWDQGDVVSPVIGPAKDWKQLLFDVTSQQSDSYHVNLYGIDTLGVESLLIGNITNFTTSLAGIDAKTYPYLQLEWKSFDLVNRTSPQLEYWRILYDEMPDCALRPDVLFVMKDTLEQGENQHVEIAIENISEVDMSALAFRYTIIDENNQVIVHNEQLASMDAGETITGIFDIPTDNLQGLNKLILHANPGFQQPEMFMFNNIGVTKFLVGRDQRNPLLDVTFDGIHIMDGDIVSAKPKILITLNDENKFLALSDTSNIEVRLLKPGEALPAKPVDPADLQFFAADPTDLSEENKSYVIYTPTFLEDGEYLLFVLARDQSNNESGALNYRVAFEVFNQPAISNVLNYPNPFSTSTQFVFTLTGSEVPETMKVQIMTVTGKVVREITKDELGAIHVGNNRTDYRWDGTDEYGSPLANGVYLYRVITKLNGEDMDSFQTNSSQYFKSGIGKMYLMR